MADPAFARGLRPLALGPLPRTGTRVVTYGFPLGGQDVSSTAGIVSRVESRGYLHSGADQHLVVQTDAAINPGNSGGPVIQDGRVVGVAFQGLPGADNMGFFIPVPIVRHFLDEPGGRPLRRLPRLGARHDPAPVPRLSPRAGLPAGLAASSWTASLPGDGGRGAEAGRRAPSPWKGSASRTTARSASATPA